MTESSLEGAEQHHVEDADDTELDGSGDEMDGNRVLGSNLGALLEFVVSSIVDDADAVAIQAYHGPGRVDLAVTVAPSDMGKVIGRRGHVVQAIRTLVRAAGAGEGIEASVEIVD